MKKRAVAARVTIHEDESVTVRLGRLSWRYKAGTDDAKAHIHAAQRAARKSRSQLRIQKGRIEAEGVPEFYVKGLGSFHDLEHIRPGRARVYDSGDLCELSWDPSDIASTFTLTVIERNAWSSRK